MRNLVQHFENFEFNGRYVKPQVGDQIRLYGDDGRTVHVTMIDDNPVHGEHGDCRAIFSRDCAKSECLTPSLVLKPMPEFQYNGFTVRGIGPIQQVRGGRTQRVEVIDPPTWLVDTKFTAVIDAVSIEGGRFKIVQNPPEAKCDLRGSVGIFTQQQCSSAIGVLTLESIGPHYHRSYVRPGKSVYVYSMDHLEAC